MNVMLCASLWGPPKQKFEILLDVHWNKLISLKYFTSYIDVLEYNLVLNKN